MLKGPELCEPRPVHHLQGALSVVSSSFNRVALRHRRWRVGIGCLAYVRGAAGDGFRPVGALIVQNDSTSEGSVKRNSRCACIESALASQ